MVDGVDLRIATYHTIKLKKSPTRIGRVDLKCFPRWFSVVTIYWNNTSMEDMRVLDASFVLLNAWPRRFK